MNASVTISRSGHNKKQTLVLKNLRFTGGTWTVHNIPTYVLNSDLSALNLEIHFPESGREVNQVELFGSQLGSFHIVRGKNVLIHESSVSSQDQSHDLLTAVRSNVNISNTIFEGNSGKTLISAKHDTTLYLRNTTFRHNDIKSGVVHLSQSTLFLDESSFSTNQGSGNGGCIQAWNHSQVEISDSSFYNNSALGNGGTIYASGHVHLNVSRTEFVANYADSGGAIVIYTHSQVHISYSKFTHNRGKSYTGTIKAYDWCSVHLYKSDLSHNSVEQSVGVLAVGDNASVSVIGCSFKNNTSQIKNTGVIYLEVNSSIVITNSAFVDNAAAQTSGVLGMYKNCTALIYDSEFLSNSAGDASGCINVVDKCILNISRTVFRNNVASFNGGAITSNGWDRVHLSHCEFTNNTAHTAGGGSIAIKETGQLSVINSTFGGNKSGYKGGALYFVSSRGTVTQCHFTENHAAIYAGAVVMENSNVTFTEARFHRNKAQSEGGALSAKDSRVRLLKCNFTENEAVYRSGGVMTLEHGTHVFAQDTNFAHNSAAYTGGVVIANSGTWVTLERVHVSHNTAKIGGAVSLQPSTKFTAVSTSFLENHGSGYAGVFFISLHSEVSLTKCLVERNTAVAMAGVAYVIRGTLKISHTQVLNNKSPKGKSIYFFGKYGNKMLTHQVAFSAGPELVSSDAADFWNVARRSEEIWVAKLTTLTNVETPFASGEYRCFPFHISRLSCTFGARRTLQCTAA